MTSQELLQKTSRAFYLSLRVLPKGSRQTMSLAYLLARCADSVSDGQWLPADRRIPALECIRQAFQPEWGGREEWKDLVAAVEVTSAEGALLHHFPQAMREWSQLPPADAELVRDIVLTLSQGMQVDLERFPGSVQDDEELRRHLWAAAGCVGSFWTRVTRLHEPALSQVPEQMEEWGTRLGNALQLTNVLRDLHSDLQEGRCYLPAQGLAALGLSPEVLLQPESRPLVQSYCESWMDEALRDFEASQNYILAIPWYCWRLRLAALWPWVMGVATLVRLQKEGWLRPYKVKVGRKWVYSMIVRTALLAPFTGLLRRYLRACLEQASSRGSKAA